MYDTNEIRERVDLAALIEETVTLRRSGTALLGMCPFHENHRTPALAVFTRTKTWKCFGCGKGGDVFAWWMELHQVDFKEALAEMARRANVTSYLTPSPSPTGGGGREERLAPLPTGPGEGWRNRAMAFIEYCRQELRSERGGKAREYLEKERGLWPETWESFLVGYNPETIYDDAGKWGFDPPKDSLTPSPSPIGEGKKSKIWLPRGLVIPGLSRGGMPYYVKIRRPRPKDSLAGYIGGLRPGECITEHGRLNPDNDPKFGGPRGGQATLIMGAGWYAHPALVLVEGEWDLMLAWQYGHDLCGWGTLGAAGRRAEVSDLIRMTRYAALGMVMDDDAAGDQARAYWQGMGMLENRMVMLQPPDHDLTDFWKHGGNLRVWVAGTAAMLLEKAVEGVGDGAPGAPGAPDGWRRQLEWARMEATPPPLPLPLSGGGRRDRTDKCD